MKYTEILEANNRLGKEIKSQKYRVGILSNVIINSLEDILKYKCFINGINPVIEIGNYDNIVQDSFAVKDKNLVIIFYDSLNILEGFDEFFESISLDTFNAILLKFKSELDIVFKNLENTPSVIFNTFSTTTFVSPSTSISKSELLFSELNIYLRGNAPKNFHIVNIDKIFSVSGTRELLDYRFFHSSKAPYTIEFFQEYLEEIEHILLRNNGKLKKAIIFDCDNTLWKGILGEDGVEKIDMAISSKSGKVFNKVQRIAAFLSQKGIIVGLCSKNNEEDVIEVLKSHKDIFLKEQDIAVHKINWTDKATNLRQISEQLNIGLDSVIFVDDSPFEINLVNAQLPEITTIQVPKNTYSYPALLLSCVYKYFNLEVTTDDLNKTRMYKEQDLRNQEKEKYIGLDEYLTSLEIEIEIVKDDIGQVARLSQLTQKTNQFNLTTKRYTELEIKNFIESSDDHVFSLAVKDKFGDNGITGLCILRRLREKNTNILLIDTLLMSCRIIGRNIEYEFISNVINYFKDLDFAEIHATYSPTKKNGQVKDFYDKLNFRLVSHGEERNYIGEYKTLSLNRIPYINIKSNKKRK